MSSRVRRSIIEQVADFARPLQIQVRQQIQRFRQRQVPGSGQAVAPALLYVSPGLNWATDTVAYALTSRLRAVYPGEVHCLRQPFLASGQFIHYGEPGTFLHFASFPRPLTPNHRNQVIVTVFHIVLTDRWGSELPRAAEKFFQNVEQVERIVTASKLMENRLQALGISPDQLIRLPLGVDLKRFRPPTSSERSAARRRFGVPEEAICIGSFQKDGQGWGEGYEPKLIKGPDIFLQVVSRLQKQFPIFVLLTGPARGYVRRGLEALGVPYHHVEITNHAGMVECYHSLDLYLITSREEGGPHALLESLACGVPLVTTRVGMTPELIQSGINGFLTEVDDPDGMAESAALLLQDPGLRQKVISQGLQTVQDYDWDLIARRYLTELYRPLLDTTIRKKSRI